MSPVNAAPLSRSSDLTRTLLAPNPGRFTLQGTNTYLIASPESPSVVVVDPGPDDTGHVERLAAIAPIDLVLITHRHPDHTGAIDLLREKVAAPVRAVDAEHCRSAEPLAAGELIEAAGVRIRVVGTPGHTADSVSFHLPEDGPAGSLLSGDTILGTGSTTLAEPDGALAPYFDSLRALRALGPALVLPGHGPTRPNLVDACDEYIAHRIDRLHEFSEALDRLGLSTALETDRAATDQDVITRITDMIYGTVHASWRATVQTMVRTQLQYLAEHGLPRAGQ